MTTRNHYRIMFVNRLGHPDAVRFRLVIDRAAHADLALDPETFQALCLDLGLVPTDASGTEYVSAERPLCNRQDEEEGSRCQRCGRATGFKTFGLCDACIVECQDAAAARGEDWP